MKTYAIFNAINPITKESYTPCGSDSVFRLDGRNTITGMIKDSRARMRTLSQVKSFIGGRIVQLDSLRDLDTWKENTIAVF